MAKWICEAHILPDGDEHVNPDLPVLDGIPNVLHGVLVGKGAPVMLEASRNLMSLLGGEKFGGIGVVIHDPECKNG